MAPDESRLAVERFLSEKAEDLREVERGAIANQTRIASQIRAFGALPPRPGRGR